MIVDFSKLDGISEHDLPYVPGAHHHEFALPNGDAHGHERCATSAGLPLTKSESTDGRKKLPNGMFRVHRIMTEEELAQGKEPRWTELEIRGLFFLNFWNDLGYMNLTEKSMSS